MPRVPGSRALAFASRWFDRATVTRVFEPLIADWQREWQEASPVRRARVSWRGLAAFVCAVLVSSPQVAFTAVPSAVTNRVASRMTRFIAVPCVLSLIPFLSEMSGVRWSAALWLFVLPPIITLAFPFSMIGATDAIRRYEPLAPQVERAMATKLAAFALLFMIVFGGWVVPAANQAWRVGTTTKDGAPARGVRELTTFELLVDPTRASEHEAFSGGADRATRIQRQLNNRAALTVVPVFLLWLRWRSIDTGSKRWRSPLPPSIAAILSCAVFVTASFSGWWLERRFHLSPGVGYWLPIVIMVLWGATRERLIPRRAAA